MSKADVMMAGSASMGDDWRLGQVEARGDVEGGVILRWTTTVKVKIIWLWW